jgi:hypothetical protein
MTTFRRGDLVEYNDERWTVSETTSSARTPLCRTDPGGPPLGATTEAPAGELRLITRNVDRTMGKGTDIDHINRQDRLPRT